jgi:hypothetical protein
MVQRPAPEAPSRVHQAWGLSCLPQRTPSKPFSHLRDRSGEGGLARPIKRNTPNHRAGGEVLMGSKRAEHIEVMFSCQVCRVIKTLQVAFLPQLQFATASGHLASPALFISTGAARTALNQSSIYSAGLSEIFLHIFSRYSNCSDQIEQEDRLSDKATFLLHYGDLPAIKPLNSSLHVFATGTRVARQKPYAVGRGIYAQVERRHGSFHILAVRRRRDCVQ